VGCHKRSGSISALERTEAAEADKYSCSRHVDSLGKERKCTASLEQEQQLYHYAGTVSLKKRILMTLSRGSDGYSPKLSQLLKNLRIIQFTKSEGVSSTA
jgi:hypothetical protein